MAWNITNYEGPDSTSALSAARMNSGKVITPAQVQMPKDDQSTKGLEAMSNIASMANTAKNAYSMFGGGSAAGSAATAGTAASEGAATTAAGSTAASGASAGSNMMSALPAAGPWALPAIAATGLTIGALAEGDTPEEVFGEKGWGGQPFTLARGIYEGKPADIGKAVGGPVGGISALANGESELDVGKATLGGAVSAFDNIFNKGGGSFLDWINAFANPTGGD